MKAPPLSFILVLGAIQPSSWATNPVATESASAEPVIIHTTSIVDSQQTLLVGDGDSEAGVAAALGQPDEVLAGTVWIYRQAWQRRLPQVRYAESGHRCDAALIVFTPGRTKEPRRVLEIVLVRSSDAVAIAQNLATDREYLARRVAARRAAQAAPAAAIPPFLIHVKSVMARNGARLIEDGDSEDKVREAVGRPGEILPGEVWAFPRFEKHRLTEIRLPVARPGYDLMLVAFTPGVPGSGRRVTAIAMIHPERLAEVVNHLKADPAYLQKRVQCWHESSY